MTLKSMAAYISYGNRKEMLKKNIFDIFDVNTLRHFFIAFFSVRTYSLKRLSELDISTVNFIKNSHGSRYRILLLFKKNSFVGDGA